MLFEIPIKRQQQNETNFKSVRIPNLIFKQEISVHEFISSNYYLQTLICILYFINIPEFTLDITLPKGINILNLESIPFIQVLSKLFKYQRAIVDEVSSNVLKVTVKGLSLEAIEYINILNKSNKIDPILIKLFKKERDINYNTKNTSAYVIKKEVQNNKEKEKISDFQQYLLWECINNDNFYGFPIAPLNFNDLMDENFQNFTKVFENTFIVGSGEPWNSTHMILSKAIHPHSIHLW